MKSSELPHTILQLDIHKALGLIKIDKGIDMNLKVDSVLRDDPDIKNALRRVKVHADV